MPVIPAHKSPLSILKGFREELATRTNITNFERDTKIRAISDTLSDELINLREEQITITYANQISNAAGRALDEIGERLGLSRIRGTFANTLSSERNIAFYVESGNFGAINSGSPISLGIGDGISSLPNNNELGAVIEYQLTEPLVLGITESLVYCSARAVNSGSASNVGKSVLRQHNFTNYTDSANSTLKVVNLYPILNGVDDESDDLYKYRLANHYNRLLQNNEVRMKLTALTVPGIVNTRIEPGYFGIGTVGVFALGAENQSNARLLESLQQRLDSWKIPAGDYLATPATEVTFDFEIEVRPSKQLTTNQIIRLKSEINRSFLQYFRTLTIGSVVDTSILAKIVQKRMQGIAPLGRRGDELDRIFKKVYIRKGFSNSNTDEKERLISKVYILNRDEYASLGTLSIGVI